MSKTLVWVVVVGLLLVGGYFGFRNKDVENVQVIQESTEEGQVVSEEKKMAFSQFLKQGGAYKCEVKQYIADTETTGTTYINNGMVRGEFNTKVQSVDVQSTFIMRDGYSYYWSSMMPNTGFKVKVDTEASGDAGAGASGSYGFNAEQIGDYNCEAWTVDQSKFTIPTNITFKTVEGQ